MSQVQDSYQDSYCFYPLMISLLFD